MQTNSTGKEVGISYAPIDSSAATILLEVIIDIPSAPGLPQLSKVCQCHHSSAHILHVSLIQGKAVMLSTKLQLDVHFAPKFFTAPLTPATRCDTSGSC